MHGVFHAVFGRGNLAEVVLRGVREPGPAEREQTRRKVRLALAAGGLQQPDYVTLTVLGGFERLPLDAVAVGRGNWRAWPAESRAVRLCHSWSTRRFPAASATPVPDGSDTPDPVRRRW